jgi:hypothetical protein
MQAFKFAGTVSRGTMRSMDLIPTFASVLDELDTDGKYDELVRDALSVVVNPIYGGDPDQTLDELVMELFHALAASAPDGYVFGQRKDGRANYGFWEISNG